jgi:hypothetical protein
VGSNYYLSQSKSQQKEQKIPRGRSGNASKWPQLEPMGGKKRMGMKSFHLLCCLGAKESQDKVP